MIRKQTFLDKILAFAGIGAFILLSLVIVLGGFDKAERLEMRIKTIDVPLDTTHSFPGANLLGPGKIHILKPTAKMSYLSTDTDVVDPLYGTLMFIGAIIAGIFFWDFSYLNPFTKKALWGVRILGGLLFAFLIINLMRYSWLTKQIKELTDGKFVYDTPSMFALPEFWILVVLMRLIRIFSKGVTLQHETQLTI